MQDTLDMLHLRDYWLVVRKRRVLILGVFLSIVLAVGLFTVTTKPIYMATTTLSIEPENPNVVSIEEVFRLDASTSDYYQTQYSILASRTIARTVIEKLKLLQHEEFFPPPGDSVVAQALEWVKDTIKSLKDAVKAMFSPPPAQGPMTEEELKMLEALEIFSERLNVEPVRNSRLVIIGFEANDPALSQQISDTIARSYIELNLETRLGAVQDAMTWLNGRISTELAKVEASEARFQAFKDKHQIISDFSTNIEEVTAKKLADLRVKVTDAEAQMIEARTRYEQTRRLMTAGNSLDSIPAVLENELIISIKQKQVELANRKSELARTYGPNHPQIQAVDAEIHTLEARMRTEANKIMEALENQYQIAKVRYDSLHDALKAQEQEALSLNKLAAQYNTFKQDAVSAREIFDLLVKRFKETSLSQDMPTVNIHVVDAAELPQKPVKPKLLLNMALALVLGLGFGLGLAFFLEYLDNTLKTPGDVKRWLNAPFLGVIPFQQGVSSESTGSLASVVDAKSMASEAYRSLRTGVLFSLADHEPQVIQITSASPAEGKTLTAVNLAVTMAQADSKTLIIDCDLRRPTVHKALGLSRQKGISNILANPKEDIAALIQATAIPNLFVLPAGPIPPNPSELLGGKRLSEILTLLRGEFERIIIDTPPVTAVTDSSLVSKQVDGVLMVAKAFDTSRDVVRTGLEMLRKIEAKILGVALNAVKLEKEGYYYYQYYYYYYADGRDGRGGRGGKTGRGRPEGGLRAA